MPGTIYKVAIAITLDMIVRLFLCFLSIVT